MVKSGIIARQPILSRSGKVYGYELLYRNSNTNMANVLMTTKPPAVCLWRL